MADLIDRAALLDAIRNDIAPFGVITLSDTDGNAHQIAMVFWHIYNAPAVELMRLRQPDGRGGTPMKIYIAGRITGAPNYWGIFSKAEEQLEQRGFVVLNPARNPEGMERADYMRICFAMIDCADMVALLPGWEQSPVARLESDYCTYIGKPVNTLKNVLRASERISKEEGVEDA